jgi:hypothetical protein
MSTTNQTLALPRRARVSILRGMTTAFWGAVGLAVLLLAIAVLLRWYEQLPHLEDPRWRMLLTALGIAAGAWVLRPIVVAANRLPKFVTLAGIAGILLSQICYYLLVWTTWKSSTFLWRVWWIALVVGCAAAHVSWVRLLVAQPEVKRWARMLAWIVYTCIPIAVAMVIPLVLGRTPLPDTSLAYQIALAVPLGVENLATIVLAIRALRLRAREVGPFQKLIWTGVALTATLAIGFYAGRVTAPTPSSLESIPAALAHLTLVELDTQLTGDLNRLRIVTAGLDELANKARAAHQQLNATLESEKRSVYRPAEEDQIRSMFMSYLAYRAALLRLAAAYSTFQSVPDPSLRARAFLIGFCAGTTVMDASQRLVNTYRDEPPARKKLNEPDDSCGIPAGTFDRIYAAVTNPANIEKIDEMAEFFKSRREQWRDENLMSGEDFDWLDARISQSLRGIHTGRIAPTEAYLEQIIARVKSDTYTPMYAAQSVVSTLIGDTRMVSRAPFITLSQVRLIQPSLKPGDIFLERRNWFMSNAFLPGFWPHAAMYIGTMDELEKLGLVRKQGERWTSDEPAIRDRLDALLKGAHDGQPITVIESVSEGVIFNSLTHSMHADYVAVLRPRKLADQDRAKAIARAFAHVGKPYDFEFDFSSADKLVCTELVYRSYDGLIKFDLVPIMGRSTLPALEIARKFSNERERPDRELDFVLFLDAVPGQDMARLASVDEFCRSVGRPRGFNE